jgi:hypothetical protein
MLRWFAQWKERHQIHFKFGDWGYTHTRVTEQSLSTAAAGGGGTITGGGTKGVDIDVPEALKVDTHQDKDRLPKKIKKNHEYSDTSSNCNPSGLLINNNNNTDRSNNNDMKLWRQPILELPKPYSHRFQCIMTSKKQTKGDNEIIERHFYLPPPIDAAAETNEWLCIY